MINIPAQEMIALFTISEDFAIPTIEETKQVFTNLIAANLIHVMEDRVYKLTPRGRTLTELIKVMLTDESKLKSTTPSDKESLRNIEGDLSCQNSTEEGNFATI